MKAEKSKADSYTLTPGDVASITDVEMAFSTERLLPAWNAIPDEFKRGNLYTQLAAAIFYGSTLPDCELEMHAGFEPEQLNRAVRAHLGSFSPKHEHKVAGVGYLIAQCCTLSQNPTQSEHP